MDALTSAGFIRRLGLVSRLIALLVAAGGTLVLVGYIFGIEAFKSLAPGLQALKFNSAIGLLIASLGLWHAGGADVRPVSRRITESCGIVLVLIGVSTLLEYFSARDFGFDQFLFTDREIQGFGEIPGRMSPMTAVNFVFVGTMYFLHDRRLFRQSPSNVLAFVVIAIAFFALIGNAYGVSEISRLTPFTFRALHMLTAFLLLGTGFLLARADTGCMRTLSSDALGGVMLRRVLLVVIAAPAVIGWLRLQGELAGYFDTRLGVALFALANILILVLLLWWTGASINAADERRRQAVGALRASEQRYHELFEYSPLPVWVFSSRTGLMVAVNESALRQYGYTREQFLALRQESLLAVGETAIASDRQIGPGTQATVRHRTSAGIVLDVEMAMRRVTVDGEEAVLVVAEDVTRKKADEAGMRRLAAIVQSSEDAIIGKTLDGIITNWNDGATKIFGHGEDEMVGQSIRMLVPPDRAGEEDDILARISRGEHIRHFESVRMHKEGRGLDVSMTVSPIRDEGGSVVGASTIIRDIGERKEAERALRHAEARFRGTLDGMMEGCQLVGFDWRYLYVNDVAAAHGRRSREELLGATMMESYPGIDQSPVFAILRECMDARIARRLQNEFTYPDGSHGWFELVVQPVAEGIFILSKDITKEKEMEEELRNHRDHLEHLVAHRTAQLEAANKELEAFSYSVSHDLRAPLRSIDGFSQALLEDYAPQVDDVGKDYLRRVRAASQHMARLIDDLLILARVTRAELRVDAVNLSSIAHLVAEELQRIEPGRLVDFTIASEVTARGDPRLLRVVMDNLIGNAWKYTSRHKNARIEFGYINGSGPRTFFVRDDGAGFEMAYVGKLFGAFQRLHSVKEFPGTGIGLATAQRIVHRHGGKIWAEGAVERGATFYFTLS